MKYGEDAIHLKSGYAVGRGGEPSHTEIMVELLREACNSRRQRERDFDAAIAHNRKVKAERPITE